MAAVIGENEREERKKAVEVLKEQIKIEGELINQYKIFGEKIKNIPVRRMLHMIMFDSQKHIETLQTAIDIIEERDVLKDDRIALREGLKRHIELEIESVKAAEKVLKYSWVQNRGGLKLLLESWMDDEKRHHKALRQLSKKPFIQIDPNDFVTLFKGEEFLEERYLRSKRFLEKDK
jgi:rubrerythrin